MRPGVLAVIVSQEVLEPVVLKGTELKGDTHLLYRMVDNPMEISDAFHKFELTLSDLEALGYGREEVLLDATGGTTPMRLGAALAAMTRGVEMVHQRVPQVYVGGRWERDESRKRFLEEAGLNEPPRVLALYHARLLDHILNGGTTEDEAVLRDLLQKRNHSILAHGLQPIEKKSTVRFLEYVDTLVEAPEARVGAEHARLRGL